jgi:uncharacterized protein (TIGR02594 family)
MKMNKIEITAFELAQRFVGIKEVSGTASNSQILSMLQLDNRWIQDDETAWCSAFVNYVCWLLRLPRSKSLTARSWLGVGRSILIGNAEVGFDVVILQRGDGVQPGPDVIQAPGHVGFYAGYDQGSIQLLAGNQGNTVSVAGFALDRVLGIRRLLG